MAIFGLHKSPSPRARGCDLSSAAVSRSTLRTKSPSFVATWWALGEINPVQSSLTQRNWLTRQSLETSSQSQAEMSIQSPRRGRSSTICLLSARLAIYRNRWCKRKGVWPCKRKRSRLFHLELAITQMATARRTKPLCSIDHHCNSNTKRILIRWQLKSVTTQIKDRKIFLNRGPKLLSSGQSLKSRLLGRGKRSCRLRWSNSHSCNKHKSQLKSLPLRRYRTNIWLAKVLWQTTEKQTT